MRGFQISLKLHRHVTRIVALSLLLQLPAGACCLLLLETKQAGETEKHLGQNNTHPTPVTATTSPLIPSHISSLFPHIPHPHPTLSTQSISQLSSSPLSLPLLLSHFSPSSPSNFFPFNYHPRFPLLLLTRVHAIGRTLQVTQQAAKKDPKFISSSINSC